MKFKDTIYAGRRLSHDLIHPQTGERIIPAQRKLTKFLLRRAQDAGIDIEEALLYDPKKRKASNSAQKEADRVAFLRERIAAHKAELKSLER